MVGFIIGLIAGVLLKSAYDLFREDQLPAVPGLQSGRIEALLDEIRQTTREFRDEFRRSVPAGSGAARQESEQASAASRETEATPGASRGSAEIGAAGSPERLSVTGSSESESGSAG